MAATSNSTSSGTSPAAAPSTPNDPLAIADGDRISLWRFAQPMPPELEKFVLQPLFEFPTAADRTESVIWRKVVIEDRDVHAMGCAKEADDRAKGKRREYRGFRTATAGAVRQKRTKRGHGFSVTHFPSEGPAHVNLKVEIAAGVTYSKSDRQDVRALMDEAFSTVADHACTA
jgi:hypothetical protein